jgi:hypothetical protein
MQQGMVDVIFHREGGRKAFRRCCGSVDRDIDGYPALRAEKAVEEWPRYFLKCSI